MQIQKIYDSNGKWYVNKGSFDFVDPTTGNRFSPGIPTQAVETEWIKGQPVLEPQQAEKPAKPTKQES